MADGLTVSEFAKRAGVSRQAIQQRLAGSLAGFVKVDAQGIKTIDEAALQLFTPQGTDKDTASEGARLRQGYDKAQADKLEAAEKNIASLMERLQEAEKENAAQTAQLEAIRENMEDLRRQIAGLEKDKAELNERLREAHLLTANAQQQARLLTEGKRRGLLAKLFHKGEGE